MATTSIPRPWATHRQSNTSLYRAWKHMKERCHCVTHSQYHLYGARGITVDPEWRASFSVFADYVGPRPSPKHTLDRIDNDGSYVPGNVRWASRLEQSLNTRRNVWITAFGETLVVKHWARRFDLPHQTIQHRLSRGWQPEWAIMIPTGRVSHRASKEGK